MVRLDPIVVQHQDLERGQPRQVGDIQQIIPPQRQLSQPRENEIHIADSVGAGTERDQTGEVLGAKVGVVEGRQTVAADVYGGHGDAFQRSEGAIGGALNRERIELENWVGKIQMLRFGLAPLGAEEGLQTRKVQLRETVLLLFLLLSAPGEPTHLFSSWLLALKNWALKNCFCRKSSCNEEQFITRLTYYLLLCTDGDVCSSGNNVLLE